MTDAQSAFVYVQSLVKTGLLRENIHNVFRVDMNRIPEDLIKLRFLDGSVIWIEGQHARLS